MYRLKHFNIQQMHKYIIRRYNQNYYKIYKIFKNCSNMFRITRDPSSGSSIQCFAKYFIIILILSTNYIFVHLLDIKVF